MFSSRSISTKFAWLALLFGAAGLSAQINPNQINFAGQTGCTTATYPYVPADSQCEAPSAYTLTDAKMATAVSGLTGCTTAGYAWVPEDSACEAVGGGGGGLNGVSNKATSYVAVSGDNGKNISLTCPGTCGLTLPTSVPANGWTVFVTCEGVAACTITPTSGASLLNAGGVALGTGTFTPGMGFSVWSDGTNYHVNSGGIMTGSNIVPTLVQSNWTGCGVGECDIPFLHDVVPGDAMVVEYMHSQEGTQVISDTNGDVFPSPNYTLIGGNFDITQYVVCSAIGGPTTILNTGTYTIVAVYEVANVASSSCQDGFNSGTATVTTSPQSTGSVTTTDPYDFILVTGATRGANYSITFTEANSYTPIVSTGVAASALNYASFWGTKPAAGSVSDTVSYTGEGGGVAIYAGIVALKPASSSNTIVEGDLMVAGPNGALQAYHQGAAGTAPVSNGTATMPTPHTVLTTNPLSGMTGGQVAIAGSATTITNSKVLAGSGAGITTGPTTSVDQHCAKFTGASGQLADAGAPCSTFSVNGSAVSGPNLNATTPSADSGYTAATPKVSGANVIVETPNYTGTSPIVVTGQAISCPTCGTVTSVALKSGTPNLFSGTEGTRVTTSGDLDPDAQLATQAANCVVSGPATGAAAQPTCRHMVTADLPSGVAASGANSDITSLSGLTSPVPAPGFYLNTLSAGPVTALFDDFFVGNTRVSSIGAASTDTCDEDDTYVDQNHPGNVVLISGTGGSGTGVDCEYSGGNATNAKQLSTLNSSLGWTWSTAVYVAVLPGTTASAYQAGMADIPNASPWNSGIGWYLSSANGVANDWYCGYGSTYTDSGTAATVAWVRLSMVNDGTYLHWYINGVEATACKVTISSVPSTIMALAWTAVSLNGATSFKMGVDYVYFQRAVSR